MFTPPSQSSPCNPTEAGASAPSRSPPWRVSRQASRAGECWSALILCVGISLFCPLHPCCCALLCGGEASPLRHPQSLPAKGFPSMWKPFLLHSSLPLVQVPSLFFCLCFFFFLLPYPGTWGVSCLLGGLRSSGSVQWVFYRSSSTFRCISDVSVGRKVISMSYSSAIFSWVLSHFLSYFNLFKVLPKNWVHLLVGVEPIDTTKPKRGRRKDLLLLVASKENTGIFPKAVSS